MDLKERLTADLTKALKSGDNITRDTIRLLRGSIKNAEIASGRPLDEAGVVEVLAREAKQRRDAIGEFRKGQRMDLVAREEAELRVIEAYLPQQLTEVEIEQAAQRVIGELGVTDVRALGEVMKRLMPELKGKADGKTVNEIVRRLLQERSRSA